MIDGGLRKLFRANIKGDWCSIESGLTDQGIPDSNYCIDGVEGWIEYKACKHWRVAIRPAQVGWIERRIRNGGRVFIAIRRADNELWLFKGASARWIKLNGLKGAPRLLDRWEGGEGRWDWGTIRRILVSTKL